MRDPQLRHAKLVEAAADCVSCELFRHRKRVVFGEGPIPADVLLVGEGPGEEEDGVGRPFVGPAGQLLDRILLAAGISRESLYITNVVKCRPQNNRRPHDKSSGQETDACTSRWLRAQIDLVAPRILVPLGSVASAWFTGQNIRTCRGRWSEWKGVAVLPLFHPAALLYDESREPQSPAWHTWNDVRALKQAIDALPPREGG